MGESNLKAGQSAKWNSKSLATVASTTALYAAVSGVASAAPILVDDRGFSVSGNQSVDWDVDGDLSADFDISAFRSIRNYQYTSFGYRYSNANIFGRGAEVPGNSTTTYRTQGTFGGGSQIVKNVNPQRNQFFRLPQGDSNSLGTGNINPSDPTAGLGLVSSFSYSRRSTNSQSSFGSQNSFLGGAGGSGFLGFQVFEEDGDRDIFYFGWAAITITSGDFNPSLTINSWCYESDVNTPIHVGSCGVEKVPEPSTPALLLLGLGAAGIRRWRDSKRARSAA